MVKLKGKIILFLVWGLKIIPVMGATQIPISINEMPISEKVASAYISSSYKTMLPIRTIGETLGLEITWEDPYIMIEGQSLDGKVAKMKGNMETGMVEVGGQTLKDNLVIKDGRCYIASTAFSTAFGYEVNWENKRVCMIVPQEETPVILRNTVPLKEKKADFSISQELLELVNDAREEAGCLPLKIDETLCELATLKAEDMRQNNYFDHISPTYGSPFEMLQNHNINYKRAGENIARGYTSVRAVFEGWMASEGHRQNILNKAYTVMGLGYDSQGNYWAQLFMTPENYQEKVAQSTKEQKGYQQLEVLKRVNQERQKAGLGMLKLDEGLCHLAQLKSEDMRKYKYFDHTSPNYGSPFEMLHQFNITYRMAGENIAKGYDTAEDVTAAWMASEGHRANIMNASYTHLGVGYDQEGGYWTQFFMKK